MRSSVGSSSADGTVSKVFDFAASPQMAGCGKYLTACFKQRTKQSEPQATEKAIRKNDKDLNQTLNSPASEKSCLSRWCHSFSRWWWSDDSRSVGSASRICTPKGSSGRSHPSALWNVARPRYICKWEARNADQRHLRSIIIQKIIPNTYLKPTGCPVWDG